MLYAFIVRVCVCTSGEPLIQPLLSEAAAVERHNSTFICPLLLPLGPASASLRQPTAF